ncbi:1-acyl-sn-glycerol-3-phosphate acyltransferase [Phormidium pseudopriestleyi FRX01]|uniref:1-acyl-sn-glycerol-3-phosphate acyltransferase n=1 Tax=Phormidium pseudopriestleyi FRX01 TaxID=1759528 RepID=A0ABS3FT74_9CYAN|nr:lysophospholipid acyltransferase family protein [Phormidium pseudopriestleyi]MBO0350326.1 1-acyl-sn-glycerol-3-phosphate acyltransferase [Phormidium pseudopriestleyi FRX01]
MQTPLVKSTIQSEKNPSVNSKISPWLASALYPLGRFIVLPAYFKEIEVIGQEHIPTAGPTILAPTHRSRWDGILVAYATGRHITGRDLRYMVSIDEFKGISGWLIPRLGGFPIDRNRPVIGSLRHGIELLESGEMLAIFPEGGIFHDDELHPLKPGLARLAIQAESLHPNLGVKIVPMNMEYQPRIPHWRSQVKITIAPPLEVSHYCLDTPKESGNQLTADLETVLRAIGQDPR